MPITFNQINAQPDIISSERYMALFPKLPGGVTSDTLTVLNCEVTIPPFETAQIIVKIMGWSLAFAGRRVQQNTLSMGFFENINGSVHYSLLSWQKSCHGFLNATGMYKKDYAVDIELRVYDTTGTVSMSFRVNNAWPMRVTPPPLTEGAQPYRVDTDFSVDSVDFLAVVDEEQRTIYGSSYNSNLNSYKAKPLSALPFNLPYMDQQLSLTAAQSHAAMNAFLNMKIRDQVTYAANGIDRLGGLTGLSTALGINVSKRFGG